MSWIDGFDLDAIRDKAEVYDGLMKGQGVERDRRDNLYFFTNNYHDMVSLEYSGNVHTLQIRNQWTSFEFYLTREEFLSLCTLICKHFDETIKR